MKTTKVKILAALYCKLPNTYDKWNYEQSLQQIFQKVWF